MAATQQSPVSPIEMAPLPVPSSNAAATAAPPAQVSNAPSSRQKASWLPFTLQWYYLAITTFLSVCIGSIIVYLTIFSQRNHGLGANDGSSSILFGWRFTPTLIAVLYAQMTVILFEDVKRTEPFARLANAPSGGVGSYGTILQSPRAWWAIFTDVCFRRKRIGKTSWTLICAAFVNVVALLGISPLSSAFLTSEEVVVPKVVPFDRIIPRANSPLPAVPIRETYYRTISAMARNISTSVWLNDTSLTLPFWPASEPAQFGPNLVSSYGAWKMNTTTLQSRYECQNMTLESSQLINKQYFGVYDAQGRGPLKGTQPMVTYVLKSGDGCNYELSIHPALSMAIHGGVAWSNASTFYLADKTNLPLGGPSTADDGRPVVGQLLTRKWWNATSEHPFARLNASEQCKGRDIIIVSTPWTDKASITELDKPWLRRNLTYKKSPDFEMRSLLCEPRYFISNNVMSTATSGARIRLNTSTEEAVSYREAPKSSFDAPAFQTISMSDEWKPYFDDTKDSGQGGILADEFLYSGMAPLLGVLSNFSIPSMLKDPLLAQKAALVKGRFFTETLRETFTDPKWVETERQLGEATIVQERVVVLTEIGIALAVFFYTSSILFIAIFWSSRLSHRKLNLRSDPASTVGISLLLNQRVDRAPTLQSMHSASRVDLYTALQREKYLTSDGALLKGDDCTDAPANVKVKRNWRPTVIHLKTLVSLALVLILVLVALLILNSFSERSQLSQVAFIYEADFSKFGLTFTNFAPISIAPTLVSIIVGLWWDQLDSTFRVLQPYISMSRRPTPINQGAGLTYRSKTWVGAAIKAARNRHWVLLMITTGSVLAQVLTVSMSALFERQTHNVTDDVTIPQTLNIRQTPVISQIDGELNGRTDEARQVLESLYTNASRNWLYGAGVQQSFDSPQLSWTSGGWNFLPVNLSGIDIGSAGSPSTSKDAEASTLFSANVTMTVSAIKARLDCSQVEEIANLSSSAELVDLSDDDYFWPEDLAQLNTTGKIQLWWLTGELFANTSSHTSILSAPSNVKCCSNGSLSDPQRAVIGYWSPILPPRSKPDEMVYPYNNNTWPLPIMSKWIVGKPLVLRDVNGNYQGQTSGFFFHELPKIQAARCQPVIETAQAKVMLDKDTQNIHSFEILDTTVASNAPWSEVFKNLNPGFRASNNSNEAVDIATSFGVLFLDSLLGAADRRDYLSYQAESWEDLNNNAFVFRDQKNGMNMDLMTYSMYTLARKDPEALLNYTTLASNADRTFQAFFQHFVSTGLSLTSGGYAYQPIGEKSSSTSRVQTFENAAATTTNRTIAANVTHRIRVLHLNTVATYLSTAILIWLILTTLIAICLQRKYTSSMNRDVQLIADMLVLVAGSSNFLELVAEKGVALKRSKDVKTMLGWFKDRNNEVRWGIEVVGGRNAVDWVDAPKQGFHVPDNSPPKSRWWNRWRKN